MFGLFSNKKTQTNAFAAYTQASKRNFQYQPQAAIQDSWTVVKYDLSEDLAAETAYPVTQESDALLYIVCSTYAKAVEAEQGRKVSRVELHYAPNPDAKVVHKSVDLTGRPLTQVGLLKQQLTNLMATRGCDLIYPIVM